MGSKEEAEAVSALLPPGFPRSAAELTLTLDELKGAFPDLVRLDGASLDSAAIDSSLFTIRPTAVFSPRSSADVAALVKWTFDRCTKGLPVFPIAARGAGSDLGGGPLTAGIVVDFRAHMNQIIEIGDDWVRVQPGANYGALQRALLAKGRFLPPYPASLELCTVGGAVANNASGEKTVKYGDHHDALKSLRVVMADGGEAHWTRWGAEELARRGEQWGLAGAVCQGVAMLLDRGVQGPPTTKNSSGFTLWKVKQNETYDIGQLFVGSQGTLGLFTEIELWTQPAPKNTVLMLAGFSDLDSAGQGTLELLPLKPSALEIVDQRALELVLSLDPDRYEGVVPDPIPAVVLLVEFDGEDQTTQAREAQTVILNLGGTVEEAKDVQAQTRLWTMRRSVASTIWKMPGNVRSIPIIEDAAVPTDQLPDFIRGTYELLDRYGIQVVVWGHAGDANLHIQPFFDLSDERQMDLIWPLTKEFHAMIARLGGTLTAEHNDGILRTPYMGMMWSQDDLEVFRLLKVLFDPYGIMNPGKKVGLDEADLPSLMRDRYDLSHLLAGGVSVDR